MKRPGGLQGLPGAEPELDGWLDYGEYSTLPTQAMTREEYDRWHEEHCSTDLHVVVGPIVPLMSSRPGGQE